MEKSISPLFYKNISGKLSALDSQSFIAGAFTKSFKNVD